MSLLRLPQWPGPAGSLFRFVTPRLHQYTYFYVRSSTQEHTEM